MYSYVAVVHDRLRPTAAGAEEVVLQTMLKRGKPLGWLLGKNPSYRIWDTVSGRAIYVTLNPISQILLLSSMAICVAYLALETVVRKRQGKLPSFLSWTSHDGASLGMKEKETTLQIRILIGQQNRLRSYSKARPVLPIDRIPLHMHACTCVCIVRDTILCAKNV